MNEKPNIIDAVQYMREHPKYYIEQFLKIQPKGEPLTLFKLNPSQQQVLDIIEDDIKHNRPLRYVICKNRQVGLQHTFRSFNLLDYGY